MIDRIKLENLKNYAKRRHIPIIQDGSIELLKIIFALRKPKKVLEIGTAVGYSSICFSEFLSDNDSKIITVELDEETSKEARNNISEITDSNIEVVNYDGYEYMKSLDETFDIIFIDAAKGQYMKYLSEAYRLTKSGSIIIADNILFRGMVLSEYNEHKHRTAVTRLREYIKEVKENEKLISTIIDIGDGLAVSIVK